jgi:hypothetical protein
LKIRTHKSDFEKEIFGNLDPKSPNEKYILNLIPPYFKLYEDKKLILSGEMKKPSNAAIANNGTFALMDNLVWPKNKHLFYVISKNGNVLLEKESDAFITNTYISENGKYAIFRTSNTKTAKDGYKLFFFNINTKELLFKMFFDNKWPKPISINEKSKLIIIHHDNKHQYTYNFEGELIDEVSDSNLQSSELDEKKYDDLKNYSLFNQIQIDYDILKCENNKELYRVLIKPLIRCSTSDISPHTKAKTFRILGEIYYNLNNNQEAFNSFEQALNLYEKIGVKKLYNKLKKELEK